MSAATTTRHGFKFVAADLTTRRHMLDVDAIRDEAARIEARQAGLSVTVTRTHRGAGVVVQFTRRATVVCSRCGEPLHTDRPSPVDWIDERDGATQGTWNHQHGCGQWNTPAEVIVRSSDDDTTETIISRMSEALDDLAREVAAQHSGAVDAIRRRLIQQLGDAVAALGADPGDETWLTGSEVAPGICRDPAGGLIAWDWDPDGSGDVVDVTEAELVTGLVDQVTR